jgi:ribonuclease HI
MTRKTARRGSRRLYPTRHVYISGATIGNPGPGASAVAWMEGDKLRKIIKGARDTTIPEVELKALEFALENFPPEMDLITRSGSEYVVKGMTRWRLKWARRKWKNGNGRPVAHRDRWERIIELHKARTGSTIYRWTGDDDLTNGEGGDPMDDKVDRLAKAGARAVARRKR